MQESRKTQTVSPLQAFLSVANTVLLMAAEEKGERYGVDWTLERPGLKTGGWRLGESRTIRVEGVPTYYLRVGEPRISYTQI